MFSLYFIDRLKELLRAKLTECGWKDQMKAHCKGKGHRTIVKTHSRYSQIHCCCATH